MSWAQREAARIGNNNALETAEDAEFQRQAREVRAINVKRTNEARSRSLFRALA